MTIRELELQLTNNDIIFAFSGCISYNLLATVSTAVKENLEESGSNRELYNVYYIFVELLQNIMNYSTKKIGSKDNGVGTCFVARDRDTNKFSICSGNMISCNSENVIREKIDKINSCNKDELKALHKEIRKFGKDVHDKGAGLGLVEIARKSSNKLKYNIASIDGKNSYFEIYVEV